MAGALFADEESLDCWRVLLLGTIVGNWVSIEFDNRLKAGITSKRLVGSFDIKGRR